MSRPSLVPISLVDLENFHTQLVKNFDDSSCNCVCYILVSLQMVLIILFSGKKCDGLF